ncbi:hypothetical protein [Piscinibacter koreensis]|uniref:Uncharacterized protein n=1 Tax=Piscinibacter koreensis TaxID=2742824 RepID=A0A7Y6NKC1_9BURK|nr:hypothetical protein [Schlegelella koreensis]NUZ04752.1 hypothetical protein [Schlegelella koreensis]
MARAPARRRGLLVGAGALLLVMVLALVAARRVTLLVLDVPEKRATLLVKRSPALGMRFVESEASLCDRQKPGSPLHSIALPASFCPLALATGPVTSERNVLLRLPFVAALHRLAG